MNIRWSLLLLALLTFMFSACVEEHTTPIEGEGFEITTNGQTQELLRTIITQRSMSYLEICATHAIVPNALSDSRTICMLIALDYGIFASAQAGDVFVLDGRAAYDLTPVHDSHDIGLTWTAGDSNSEALLWAKLTRQCFSETACSGATPATQSFSGSMTILAVEGQERLAPLVRVRVDITMDGVVPPAHEAQSERVRYVDEMVLTWLMP